MAQRRAQTAGYLIWHLSTKWRVAVDRVLKPFGLTHADYLVLGSLQAFSRLGDKPNQRELAEFAGLEAMYVSKLIRRLERSRLLRRADHQTDPRAFQLELTAHGADLVGRAEGVMRELFDQLLRPIGGRTGKRYVALVETISTLLDEAEAHIRPKAKPVPAAARRPRP